MNQAVNVSGSAHDLSAVEQAAGLVYSWTISKNGAAFQTGERVRCSNFTPDGPGLYASTLTVTDAAGRSSTQTASTLVAASTLVVNSTLNIADARDGRPDAP